MVIRGSLLISMALAATVLSAAGCGSSATTATATSPSSVTRCSVTVSSDGQVPAQGGAGRLTVSAARECAWTASVESQWLAIKAGATGQGDGVVEVAATANPDPQVRRGTAVVNEQRVDVMQAAGECSYSLSEPSSSFGQAGGSGHFDVRASSQLCAWTASSDSPWIVVRSGSSGKGSAAVQFDVVATTGAPRTGTITAAGLRFSVTQSAACAYDATPAAHTVPNAGGTVTVTVATGPACPWTVSSTQPWIAVSGPSSFTGPGTATFTVAAAAGVARAGTVVVAGQSVSINQGAAVVCGYSLSSTSTTMPAAGGMGTVGLNTSPECSWSASTNAAPWLTITSGASGTGSGTVAFFASALSAGSRTGTLTIAGQTFTVTQAVNCTFAIAPEVINAEAAGGSAQVAVTAPAGCAWTMTKDAGWLSLQAQGPQNGNATVVVTIGENKNAARVGTATIVGRPLTVNQAAPPCTYRISPTEKKVSAESNITKIDVKTAATCDWSATSNVEWIRVGWGATGRGDGETWIWYADNTTGEQRVGTVTIAGQTYTLTQQR